MHLPDNIRAELLNYVLKNSVSIWQMTAVQVMRGPLFVSIMPLSNYKSNNVRDKFNISRNVIIMEHKNDVHIVPGFSCRTEILLQRAMRKIVHDTLISMATRDTPSDMNIS